jgi:adenylate cyclase
MHVATDQPRYDLLIEDCNARIRARMGGMTIADSARAKRLREANLPPVIYFPRADVRMDLLVATPQRTYCPFRGNASYWTLTLGDRRFENIAWSYEEPYQESLSIRGHVAFDRSRMEAIGEDAGVAAPHRENIVPAAINPLWFWLMTEAPAAPSERDLVERFARALIDVGIPVWRLWLAIRTLHPQLFGDGYTWEDNGQGVQHLMVDQDVLENPSYVESPARTVLEGAGGLRRRLDVTNPTLDYALVRELHAQGATDYVAMPFVFSNGQINAISLTTRRAGGFSTADLGHVYEVLPLLTRVFEVHATRQLAANLLNVYLGRQSGAKVLNGLVKRGDGEDVHAVIWFCDLRDSTHLAETMPRPAFLRLLDQFFDCTAGAVLAHGGEVLRFIGDASLAIFPVSQAGDVGVQDAPQIRRACETALTAALDALERVRLRNDLRTAAGETPFDLGIGLHVGDVMYGNIGTAERLELSVIGAAANEAARVEAMTKTLGTPLVLSEAFARHMPARVRSLGRHLLRGQQETRELFTLAEPLAAQPEDARH